MKGKKRQGGEESSSLKDFFAILFRYKWRMLIFSAAVLGLVFAYALSMPVKYRSEAKLLVKLGPEKVIGSGDSSELVVPITPSERGKISAEIEIIKSQNLAKAVVDGLGAEHILKANVEKSLPTRISLYLQGRTASELPDSKSEVERQAILNIRRNLVVRPVDPGNLIVISYTSQKQDLAQKVVAAIIEEYKSKYIETHHTAPTPLEFLDKVIADEKSAIDKVDKELAKITSEYGVKYFALQGSITQTSVTTLSSTLDNIETELAASRAKVESLKLSLKDTAQKIDVQDPSSSVFVTGSGSGVVTVTRPNPVYQQLEHDLMTEQSTLKALEAQHKSVTERLATYREQLRKVSDNADTFDRLMRDKEKHQSRYENYLANKEQVELDRKLEEERISNIVVFEPATMPLDSEPRGRSRILALGLILAVFGSVGLAIGSDQLDHTIKKPQDVDQKIGVPTLTAIPKVSSKYSVITDRAGEYALPGDVEIHYKALKSRLLLATNGSVKPPQTFVVTSCSSGRRSKHGRREFRGAARRIGRQTGASRRCQSSEPVGTQNIQSSAIARSKRYRRERGSRE